MIYLLLKIMINTRLTILGYYLASKKSEFLEWFNLF